MATKGDTEKKSVKSAVIIMPPEDVWEQIQAIRKVHDKAYERWMPHINMLYPFIEDANEGKDFEEAAKILTEAVKDIKPFTVRFSKDSFNHFQHKKNTTLWLRPLAAEGTAVDQPHASVLDIQRKIEEAFPVYNDLSTISEAGFQPHLSLGQFKVSQVEKNKADFQKGWSPIEFEVAEIYMISRADFKDPFHIRHAIPLAK